MYEELSLEGRNEGECLKTYAMIALNKFPMWKQTFSQMLNICDGIVVRWDGVSGDPGVLKELDSFCGGKLKKVMIAREAWRCPQWREDCLRLLDEFAPDVVLCPDEDEVFGEDIAEELKAFWYSDKQGVMFDYESLVTDDGHTVNAGMPYPPDPHMKAFKWQKGLSYFPYHGNATIAQYCNENTHWKAKTKIKHYCCFRKEWEQRKHFRSDTPMGRGSKAVTLIGFGPSASKEKELIGEVWSLNNCYEALPEGAMQRCTRIFEMHDIKKRNAELARDGRLHLWHLDQLGKNGRRIYLQEQNSLITNSESLPITEMVSSLGLDFFTGTPCYMIALAIMERYTDIRMFGLDQMDWEHTVQRECFAGWCMYAIGRGIRLSGAITWLDRYKRDGKMPRYGYDWGPEFPAWMEEVLWMGHPLQVHYKIPSRVVDGKMFGQK